MARRFYIETKHPGYPIAEVTHFYWNEYNLITKENYKEIPRWAKYINFEGDNYVNFFMCRDEFFTLGSGGNKIIQIWMEEE